MLNCSDKTVVFFSVSSSEHQTPVNLYLSSLIVNYCGPENQGYILLSTNVTKVEQKLEDIPVIKEYPNIFPEDILEFPPEREIEFTIELVLGMGLISIAPYWMSPLQLIELKR